jgi:Lon protease-like protein
MERMTRVPLFLLNTVLFPGQRLPLRVFEARYMDMVSGCLKHERLFGVALIHAGAEVGAAAEPVGVGTLAHIERWEMPQPGVLHLLVRGGRRFGVDSVGYTGQLALADIHLWEDEQPTPTPPEYSEMAEFVRSIMRDFETQVVAEPYRFDDTSWVGMRLAQLLPVEPVVKQVWLEQRDPLARLEMIRTTLSGLSLEDGNP